MTTTNTLDQLNEFYRGEKSAVETYELAITNIKEVELNRALEQLRQDHAQRVDMLRDKILAFSGELPEGSGAWGAFAKAVQAGADLLGNTVAMAALEEGEDHGMRMYTDALKEGDTTVRDLVTTVLMPAQKRSHDLCRSLKRFVKAAAA
jgi:hypothetical protein